MAVNAIFDLWYKNYVESAIFVLWYKTHVGFAVKVQSSAMSEGIFCLDLQQVHELIVTLLP